MEWVDIFDKHYAGTIFLLLFISFRGSPMSIAEQITTFPLRPHERWEHITDHEVVLWSHHPLVSRKQAAWLCEARERDMVKQWSYIDGPVDVLQSPRALVTLCS